MLSNINAAKKSAVTDHQLKSRISCKIKLAKTIAPIIIPCLTQRQRKLFVLLVKPPSKLSKNAKNVTSVETDINNKA